MLFERWKYLSSLPCSVVAVALECDGIKYYENILYQIHTRIDWSGTLHEDIKKGDVDFTTSPFFETAYGLLHAHHILTLNRDRARMYSYSEQPFLSESSSSRQE
jgi:hypothetical protein